MTCYRSQNNWHSYVKNSLDEAELDEMTSHLAYCSECQNTVSLIQETADFLAKSRADLIPPSTIKINVMMAINKDRYKENLAGAEHREGDRLVALIPRISSSRYKENLADTEPQVRTCANSSHHFVLKNWGLSMVAAGLLLFTLNLASLTSNFEISHVAELNSDLGRKIALPFDKLSEVAHDALGKIESLTLSQPK